MITTEARNADLKDLGELLKTQHAAKFDAVVPATAIRSQGGVLRVKGMGMEARAGLPGTTTEGEFLPSSVMDGQIADKLGIPVAYLRRMRTEAPDLYDHNVTGWLQGRTKRAADGTVTVQREADTRRFLLRSFTDDLGGVGIGRALLSDSYKPIDNLDVLTSVLNGVKDSGVETEVVSADLTETRMTVRLASPDVAVFAPQLLDGYVSPNGGWTVESARDAAAREGHGYEVGKEPVVFGGFEVTNSETGGGAFTITPRVTVKVCANGLKFTMDAMRKVHLGSQLAEGQVRWSDETRQLNMELVQAQARDAVATFLDREYVQRKIDEITAKATTELAHPNETVEIVANKLRFTEAETAGVLDFFIKGKQITAGGVMQAITAYSQTVGADQAYDLENVAVKALEIAHAAA